MPGLFDTPTLGPCKVELWPFQERAVEAVRDEFKKGIRRTLLNMATGTGKTIVAAKIGRLAIEKGVQAGKSNRVLFLAHTTELIDQTAAKFDLLGVEPGVEQAGQFGRMMFDAEVVVASVQTLSKPGRLQSFAPDYFGLIIVDEGHRVMAPIYRRILAYFGSARVLVLTATPLRADEQEIGHVVESVAMRFSVIDAWAEGKRDGRQYLCDIHMLHPDLDIDLKKLRPSRKDFCEADTEARVAPILETICNKVREYIGDHRTVGFWPTIRCAQMFAAGMHNLGYAAEAVWGEDQDREAKVKRYRSGETQIVSNMNLFVEGVDIPETSCVILGRQTSSWSMILQQMGRGLRAGKPFCLVIDLDRVSTQFGETPAALFTQPLGILGGDGFDQEVNAILAEMMRGKTEISLQAAIEEAKDEAERRRHRQQFAVRMAIAEREIVCAEESYSMQEVAFDGAGGASVGTPVRQAVLKPASDGQIRYLKFLGIEGCEGWSAGRAGAAISYLKRQREAGKSNVWQRKRLMRGGIDAAEARNMTVGQADSVLDGYAKKREDIYGRRRSH